MEVLRNAECNPECNFEICGFDFGDCGTCSDGCFLEDLENDICDFNCDV